MRIKGEKMEKRWIKFGVLAAVLCLVIKYSDEIFRAGGLILGTVQPLLFGCVLAYILNIFMKKLGLFLSSVLI